MHTKNPAVLAMIERQLANNPKIDTHTLYGFAQELDPTVRELNPRQFHGRYVLQVHHKRAQAEGRLVRKRKVHVRKVRKAQPDRVRQVLYDFAAKVQEHHSFTDVNALVQATTQALLSL